MSRFACPSSRLALRALLRGTRRASYVGVAVAVAVPVAVPVAVAVAVPDGTGVAVGEPVLLGVGDAVLVADGVAVLDAVAVAVRDGVGVRGEVSHRRTYFVWLVMKSWYVIAGRPSTTAGRTSSWRPAPRKRRWTPRWPGTRVEATCRFCHRSGGRSPTVA